MGVLEKLVDDKDWCIKETVVINLNTLKKVPKQFAKEFLRKEY